MGASVFSEEYPDRRAQAPRGIPLIVALQGFSDAGGAVAQLEVFFEEEHNPELLAAFSNDAFLDYRARRPTVTFVEDHLIDYEPAALTLSLATDVFGKPFLLLRGYEPDLQWGLFIRTVLDIVREFEVSVTTWVHAIPMPVPHTRPIGTTVSGTVAELIETRSIWKPTTRLSASVGHALEYHLAEAGESVVGFVHLVPHYLANTEFPQVLIAALEAMMAATGLIFSTVQPAETNTAFLMQVNEQVQSNEESLEMVRSLERRYDDFMADRETVSSDGDLPLMEEGAKLPTAEQLASEFETFLAEHWGNPAENPGEAAADADDEGDETPR